MGTQDEQELRQIYPGTGGLNDESNPLLIGETQSPDLENIDFDRKSIRGSLGARKLHRDMPRLAGVRCATRPVRRVAAQVIPAQIPFCVIPYSVDQKDAKPGKPAQLDISFRLVGDDFADTLTGLDQTEDATSVDNPGLIDAPPGGEFQFQALTQRGGSDVEELTWVLGIGVLQPEGFKDNAGAATANVQPNKIRPVFAYWDDTNARMRFCVADAQLIVGQEYHLTLELATAAGNSQWYLNGYEVDQLGAPTHANGSSPLPASTDLDATYRNAMYLCRGMHRSVGKYPDAPMFRGIYGLPVAAGSATTVTDALLGVPGALNATSWIDCYVRCLTQVNNPNNLGAIRRITAFNLAGPTITCDAFAATLVGETVDIILPIETTPTDVVIQEFRRWDAAYAQAVVAKMAGKQALKDIRKADITALPDPDEAYLIHAQADTNELQGMWPLSDDGNSDLQDRSYIGNDGWFSSSPLGKNRGIHLDGERLALQRELAKEFTGHLPLAANLGYDSGYNIHGRVTIQLCRDIVDIEPDENGTPIEDALYETLFDWDDPTSDAADPVLSLRWTHWHGDRYFYFVFNSGTEEPDGTPVIYVLPVDPTFIQPEIGRKITLLFGLQEAKGGPDHRFYLLATRGTEARGWSGTINSVLGSPPDGIASPFDPKKTRISFGASVVGETSKGAGDHNSGLFRIWDAGWALRPMLAYIPQVGAGTIYNPPVDRWTSLDEPLSPHDVEPPISRDADTLAFTHRSKTVTPTSGGYLTNELDNYPNHYLLRVPAEKQRWLQEDRRAVERPLLVHVDAVTTTALTLTEPWDRLSQSAMEARVAAYLSYTDLQLADSAEVSLNPTPPDGEPWGIQEVFEDLGVLGLQDRTHWHLAVIPSAEGVPQSLYAPEWGDGLVIGWEASRGISQLRHGDGRRLWVQAVNGSLYNIRPRWVRDHPYLGRGTDTEWCLEFPHIPQAEAEERELNQPESVFVDRRTNVVIEEGIRVADNTTGATPFRLWIPNNLGGVGYFVLSTYLKFSSLAGRRTIVSRVGMAEQGGPPELLVHDVNLHWYLDDGAMVFEMINGITGAYYRLLCGDAAPTVAAGRETRARELIPLDKWVHVGVQLGVNYAGDAFLGGNFFVNGRYVEAAVQNGALVPTTIPNPDGVTSSWIAVYGQADRGTTGPWQLHRMVPFRWGLGGRISGFQADQFVAEQENISTGPIEEVPPAPP